MYVKINSVVQKHYYKIQYDKLYITSKHSGKDSHEIRTEKSISCHSFKSSFWRPVVILSYQLETALLQPSQAK
jgi:hypothetical protein